MQMAIKDFATQFDYEPVIENKDSFRPAEKFILNGMGGSHLAADLLKVARPKLDFRVFEAYGLPAVPEGEEKDFLFIASSYSGNTEEAVDFAHEVHEKGLNLAIIATGGQLIDFAQANNLAYIQMPNTGIQPRSALGFAIVALAKMTGDKTLCGELHPLAEILKPNTLEAQGKQLAETLRGKVPVIYSSTRNHSVAYNWKIKFNETGKIPAFYNVFPELNHNEMTGFDVIDSNKKLSENMHFVFLTDENDHERVQKRMEVCEKLYTDRGLPVTKVAIEGSSVFERIFNSLLVADWAAVYTAALYGAESEQVPMIEEFKKRI